MSPFCRLLNREGLQANLIRDLLHNYTNGYHKSSVPVGLGSDDAVAVKLGIALLQIVDFDMRRQVLKTMLWERYVSTADIYIKRFHYKVLSYFTVHMHGTSNATRINICMRHKVVSN